MAVTKVTRQAVPRARQGAKVVPEVRVPVAARLRVVVDQVLTELTGETGAELGRLEEELRVGLAWTAAAGDTSRVPCAVDAVRQARLALAAGDRQQARAALLAARDGLRAE